MKPLQRRRIVQQRALQEQRPLRTFRTEFNIYESSASEERYTSTITHFTESQYERHESRTISRETSSPPTKANGGDGLPRPRSRNELDAPRVRWSSSSKIGVAKEAQREESMEAENVINARGILHPLSKEMLTVGEAMSLGILDIMTGRIASSADGKSSLSIEEAARANLIDVDIASRLLGPCGLTEAGQRLSLLEAIQRELLDAERTDDRVKVTLTDGPSEVPSVSDGLSVVDAMNRGLLDPETGHFITATGDAIPIELAYAKGYLTKIETRVNIKRGPLALADAISQALIDDSTGRVVDRNSGEVYALDDALLRGIIDADVREIVSTRDDDKLTLKEAIEQGIINPKLGKYIHSLTLEKLSLKEARRRQLIVKPMSLKDASDANILDEHAKLMSPAHKSKLTILEAMARAVLDADHLKSVLNTKTGEALTLQDAIKNGIIMPEGKYVDLATSCRLTIPDAIDKGYITSIAQKSIFDIDGFKDPVSEEFISLNAAMLKGLISHKLGGSFIVDLRRGKTLSLSEATDQGYARPEVMEMLNRGIGVTEQGCELSVLEAVLCDLLDPKSGQLLDPRSKKIVPLEDAIKRCLITPDGAALLTSLLNISVTTQTVTRTIKRYVTVTDSGETVTKDYKVSYEEALRSGLINEESDEFTDPDTGKICSIHSAIRESLVSNPEVSNVEKNLPKRSKDPHSKQMIFETTVIRDINEPPKQRAASPTKAIGVSTTIICRDASTANEETIPHLIINPINNENSGDEHFNKPGSILSDAIEQNIFDPVCGFLSGPCVDHPISFNECIKHSIIDLDSATAIDPFNNENLSLLNGLKTKILNDTGHHMHSEELSMKDAMAQDYIICKPSGNADLNQLGNKLTEIPITKTASMEVNISEESSALAPIQIERGIIYDPVTALVIFTESGQSENLLSAVNEGNLKSDVVIIKDPNTGTDINISEAIKSDIFNIETGEYKDKHGKKVSLTDAARLSLITVVGTPLVAAAAAIEAVKQTMIEDPKTGEKVPREVAIERGLIKPDNLINESEKIAELFIHQIPKSDTIDNSDNQNISSPNEISKTITSTSARIAIASGNDEDVISLSQQTRSRVTTEPKYKVTIGMAKSVSRSLDTDAKPILLQRMRKKILKPCEALQSGIIDSETAKLLELRSVDKDEQTITLLDAINNKKIDANDGKIADLQRGDILSIKEAIERGILDPVSAKLIVPLTKSLSVPELFQQGLLVPSNNKIIHPESGLHLNLNEAILCEIVDPLSKLKISNGSVITLEKAIFDSMIDGKTGIVKTETAALNLVDAVKKGIFHYDDTKCSSLPLADMKLSIEKRCIDRDKLTFSHLQLQTNQSQNQIINSENKILIDDKTSTNKPEHEEIFTGKDIELTSSDVTGQYSVNVAQQKYPEDQIDNTTSTHAVPNFSEKRPAAKMNILEAVEQIYNADTETFEDPVTKEAYNFTDAMKVGLIDSSSILCDIASSQSMTTSEAVDKGLLDSKTGKIKNKNGDFISVAEATKLGLCAIVTAPIIAPYLAVKTIANAITSSNINRPNPAKVVILKKSTEMKSPHNEENMKTSDKCTKNEERQSNYNSEIFVSGRFTDFMKPLVTTLIEAIENKRIDPKYCQIIVDDKKLPYTVQGTLERNQIDLSEAIEIISRNKILIVRDKSKLKISISKDLTPKILAEEGAYDVKTERFLDPESGNIIPFHEFVLQLKVFDPDNVWVKDLSTFEKYVTLRESIEKSLIDRNIGYMVDPKSGKKINFFDAIQRDWILEKTPISIEEPLQLSIQDAIESGICDPVTGIVQNQRSRKSIDFTKSIRSGLIDMHTVSIRNPATDEIIPLEEAIKMGVFDSDKGIIVNTETKVEIDINIAFLKGLIVPRHRKPISLEAIVKKGFYRPETGKIYDSFTSQQIDIEEGVRRGIVDAFITECRDTKMGSFISLDDALTVNLLNSSTGLLRDTKAGTLVPVGDAIDKGLIMTAPLSPSLIDVIVQEYYIPRTGLVLNPMTGDFVTIGKALESGLIDARMIKIKDERQDRNVKIKEAKENDLLDLDKGILKYPYPMTLDIAYEKGYILSTNKPWSLQEALAHGSYDQKTGNFNIDSEILTLEQAITKGFINFDSSSIKEPRAGEIISLGDAIKRGLIDPKMGTANDPSTGNVITLIEALDKGLVVPAKRKISLPEAVFKGLYDPTSGKFTSPETKEKLATDSAIEKGIIDPSSVIVMDTKGDVTTFMQAIKNGIIDSKSGKFTNNTGQTIDFKEALENGLFLETHRPMSLSEAFIKGIFNEQSETFIDPQSGAQLTLLEAVQKYVIDPESISIIVKDARSGFLKEYTLLEAIQMSYINGTTGKVKDFTKDDTEISLKNAYETGLIIDKKATISLQRAIHQGLYNDQTGKIIDPNNRRSITLHEAMRKCIINPTLSCYWDKRAKRMLSLSETCRAGVIDRRAGVFKEPGANCSIPLSLALSLDLIVDIESASFSLYDAVLMDMYDAATGTFIHPSNQRKLTLSDACQEEFINPLVSLVKNPLNNEYILLGEAISARIVDSIRGTYNILSTSKTLNLREAREEGFIVPYKKPLSIEDAVKCYLYEKESGKFIDPLINEQYDLSQAIIGKIIDPETTVIKDLTSGQIKPLLAGLEDGDIDVPKGKVLDPKTKRSYFIDEALDRGLLVNVDKALTQKLNRRRSLDLQKVPLDKTIRECSIEEAIRYKLIQPKVVIVKDPRSGEFVSLEEALAARVVDPSKRGTIGPKTNKVPARSIRFDDIIVYLERPIRFEEAVEKNQLILETAKFIDPKSKEILTLKESVNLGIIDSDSALIKDSEKKRLVRLTEAFRKGIMDAEKGSVLDTATSRLHSLSKAVEIGLLTTQKQGLSFVEALEFGLYNSTSGSFNNPFTMTSVLDHKRLTLAEALKSGLIEPSTTVIRDPANGIIMSLLDAINKGRIDPIGGRFIEDTEGKHLDFLKALENGYVLAAEARQAVEEKYKLCDETLIKLLQWIADVEDKLAHQDVVNEDIQELRNQINCLKQVKEDIEAHSRPISTCLDQVRQIVLTGSDVLSNDEMSSLEKNGRSLKSRFERAIDRTDRLLKRLMGARDELNKFKSEISSFSIWLDKSRRLLEDKERSLSDLKRLTSSTDTTRDFISDVIAHQADLRFITMAAQKFVDESKEYLQVLNEFRTSLPQRLSHKEPISSQDSPVRSEVSIVTSQYKDLLSRANALSDRLSGLGGRQRDYCDALNKAQAWLRELEPRLQRILSEPVAPEPKQVEDQLVKAKSLYSEVLANERLVDNARTSLQALLGTLEGQLTPSETNQLEEPVRELQERHHQFSQALADKCQELDTALVQCQGVQDALDNLVSWLNAAEAQFKNLHRPASLQKDRLEEQQREQRLLQADLDSHRVSLEAVSSIAQELLLNSSNARVAKRTEAKLKDLQSRFDKLMDKSLRRGEFLDEVARALHEFLTESAKFDSWYANMIELLESRDLSKLDISEYESKMAQLSDKREDHRGNYEDLVRNGKNLTAKKDVTDAASIRDKIKAIESQWKELSNLLDEKQRLSKSRAERLSAYEKLRDQLIEWLNRTENRVQRLQPVAVDLERINQQIEDLKPIQKEYRDYGNTVDKLNDLGIAYDNLIRERSDSPTRRRTSSSPTKRPLRRMSQDGRSPSPNKSYAVQSPVSPGGSSGFSSRRSSQDGFHLEELSPVQQQLSEINNRYGLLGVRLTDRQSELDNTREELRKYLDNLRTLSQFLDKIQRQLPKDVIPVTKEESDKTAKQIKIIIEEMYEKQSLLDSTKTQVRDLVRRKTGASGVDNLNKELEDVTHRWKTIADKCKDRLKFLEDIKELYDTYEALHSWLGAKERMLAALGPISSDPRMVASQVQQVQVLREEFRTQQPQLDHLKKVGKNVLARVPADSPDGQKISQKLNSILQRWEEQLKRLDDRAQSLGDAVDTSREFDASLNRLRDALQGISDNLDDLPLDKDPEEQLRKIENLERQLEGQRPLLADAEAAGAQLCEVLSDPASKCDIQGKLASVGKLYNNLQKKLDHRKAEIEGNLRDGRQFEASCSKTLGWLADELGNMSEKLLVSADREILQQQLDHHEPMYRNVMGKEHEVIMLLNKGRDILARSQKIENRTLQRDLDKMQLQWDRLKKDTLDRHTKLQTCAEHCKKYYRAQNGFLPWLRQAEDRLESLKPASFKRKDIEKQLKELSSFRNEVWKKSGEFENNNTLGETFVGACDIDKDVVKNELSAMKTRWDKLNNDLLERTQSLEDTARHLTDFNENLRDLNHGLQRCEDKLTSHDALGGAAKDPKLLDRIKSLREETVALKKPLAAVRQQATDLVHKAGEQGVDATHLQDEVDGIVDRIDDLQAKLDDRCNELQSAATAVAQFTDILRSLNQELSSLENELDSMKAPGRDIRTVREQIEKTRALLSKINRLSDDVGKLVNSGENLVDSGFAADAVATRDQVDSLKRQLGKLEERARNREEELNDTLNKLQQFWRVHADVMDDINEVHEQVKQFKSVGSEVDSIRMQQDDFRVLKANRIEPISRAVDECNSFGQALIQTAGRNVNTSSIEKDLDKMNEKWNDLKERLNDRDRKLDVGLLQSGKFQEALDGLEKWLADTEEMVSNQKPPSSDYKVVKAQLQEQKFLRKMLMDRQNSMSSLSAMGQEVAAGADSKERKAIEKQLKNLIGRFSNLSEGADERMKALERAMAVAKEFQDKLSPLSVWLDKSEKKIREMELVPTDEEKIQHRIAEHNLLHKDILSKKPGFSELTDIASSLMALVGEEEANALADKLQEAADRYRALVERSEALGALLQRSKQGLRHLVLSYQELQGWMESMEARLSKHRVLAVHTERLLQQMEDLADLSEELSSRQTEVDSTTESGLELMKHISGDEALQLKDKLDSLQRRYNELVTRGSELLKDAQTALPLVQQFHDNHSRLMDWMQAAEAVLQSAEPREEEIIRLEMEIAEYRPVLDKINAAGPQLCQLSPGEGAASIEALVTRDNRRFDAIAEQIQRRAERIQLSKQRSLEVIGDIEDLLEWFREADGQLRDAEPPSSEPEIIRVQLKEHRALNDDISSQKSRVRDVISTAKKVIRENGQHEDSSSIREKMEELREIMETVAALSGERLGALEQALPLAEHLRDSHLGLLGWLEEAEQQVAMLPMPALRPELIALQQDKTEMLIQNINEHKPLVDKLNKTGEALMRLCNEEEAGKVQEVLDNDNTRYAALRAELRARQQALEQALQESSLFSDKLEGMLRALGNAAEQVRAAEPISAHPPRLRDQMEENAALAEDLAQREEAFAAVKKAASDVINKALTRGPSDPALNDIRRKLDKLNKLWADVHKSTNDRGQSLDETLAIAEKFWSELSGVMGALAELQDALSAQAPPAAQPKAIKQQQVALHEICQEIDQTKPDVEQVRQSGHELMGLCGEPDKPEVRKHIEDLDQAWDNVTALYARREENLIDAMEKAMEFHNTLGDLHNFLEEAEVRFARMGPLGSDIHEVKQQIKDLARFKADVDPHMVKVEALNRQAAELTERTSSEQAQAIKEPLGAVNRRWDALLRGVVERQRLLENALLRLGQFQHALDELLVWIDKSDCTLDELRAVAGDPQVIEVELAKLKVLVNDIQAHQTSVDTLNDAGRQIIEDGKGSTEASTTAEKLGTLNRRWRDLLQRAADRQRELEDALRESQSFTAEIQDLLSWLGDVDNAIVASKPVGGLPETASEQLERFMELYNELEQNRPKVETVLQQGKEYLKRAPDGSSSGLNHNLRTLKQRWDNVIARASDKKIKLEIALKEATEFHDALQAFVDWLTNAEKTLTNLKPVSRVMETILSQIEDHKAFQKDVGVHRETMLNLDKKGTHLKYFSQKQDVILIKNLLISVQHRWERVVSKSAERTRALDHGYKEAREFHDAWSNLMNWLDDTEKALDEVAVDGLGGNDPDKIKFRLQKHREIQLELSTKQGSYDTTMKNGKTLKDKAPKSDEPALRELLNELKSKWTAVCNKSIDKQRKLEEALLYSGQFKDAVQALLDWLHKTEKVLSNTGPLHGDLDTVTSLVEQHRNFESDLESRALQMDSVTKTGRELESKATIEDATSIRQQLSELHTLWNTVTRLSNNKSSRLEEALRDAEQLHKAVHVLLEWLSDAEMKLRFAGQLPEDEQESRNQLMEHEKFLRELSSKEVEKDNTLELARTILAKAHPDGAAVIKHWITIIQSRWEEVATWAHQRNQRLETHMQGLQDLDNLLEELLAWLEGLENTLIALEAEPLPDDHATLEMLISDHREFMENTARRQNEVDRVCKARQIKPIKDTRKVFKSKPSTPIKEHYQENDYEHSSLRKQSFKGSRDLSQSTRHLSRASPGRERTPDPSLPHIGPRFPPKGSKGAEPEFRNPRVKLLWDRWRNVWMLAWERQRRLQDKLNYIEELDRVANFSWEDWRKRFLKFMNHKKSRLTDLFRKMDKNNDGLIPREDFIQGILNTKFDTSRLEMGAVADLFDRHGEGLIDWKEFIAALRPDWEERRTYNDTDKIHDEVKRLVMLCTCRQKFRVFQVGEGKYRFGDSQKLRLVRILRSTVMVRVGGGWVALDEFLLKNDPCRAKGRTNIELREQFILADGVSQSMTAFRSKPSPTSTLQRNQLSSAGPITKVRERSARSVPMGQTRASRTSLNAGTPDSLSDNESSFRTPARKTSTPYRSTLTPGGSRPSSRPASRPASRPGSRPASRQGSKPSSRYGSTQSLDSTDDPSTPSRIPRRTGGTTGNTPTSSRHNSISGKRLTISTVNGSGSRPRTPTGLVSPASGTASRFSSMNRASSIPTLTGVGTPISRSRIPVYVGPEIKSPHSTTSNISTHSVQSNHSTISSDSTGSSSARTSSTTNIPMALKQARTRTPSSGTSTPLPPASKLTRKPSGASDTAVTPIQRKPKQPTPIEQRAPFRL